MHRRWGVWSAGAVLTATAGMVLSASPAHAACGATRATTPAATPATQWQVGMQVADAPVSLSGAGGLPAVLLGAIPQSTIAVEDAHGRSLLGLNASSRLAEAHRPALAGDLSTAPTELPGPLVLAEPVAGVPAQEADQGRARAAGVAHAAQEPTQQVDRTLPEAVAAPVEVPLQVPGTDSVLGGRYAWVPIEGIAGLGPDSGGLLSLSGLALAVLVGGAGAVTLVARHRRTFAG